MIQLPDGLLVEHFDGQLRRGRLIRFMADNLSDPNIFEKYKYAVVLSLDCSEATIFIAFTTSRTAFFDANRQFESYVLRFAPGTYACFTVPTVLNLREVRPVEREKLKSRILSGELTFEGELSEEHLRAVNAVIAASRLIAPRTKRKILRES